MISPEFHVLVKREQYRDYLAAQAEDRLAQSLRRAEACPDSALGLLRHRLACRMAPPLGRALFRLGLRFVRAGTALERYRCRLGHSRPRRPA